MLAPGLGSRPRHQHSLLRLLKLYLQRIPEHACHTSQQLRLHRLANIHSIHLNRRHHDHQRQHSRRYLSDMQPGPRTRGRRHLLPLQRDRHLLLRSSGRLLGHFLHIRRLRLRKRLGLLLHQQDGLLEEHPQRRYLTEYHCWRRAELICPARYVRILRCKRADFH